MRTRPLAAVVMVVAFGAMISVAAASTGVLGTNGALSAGQDIVSPDGHYQLAMQANGTLAVDIVGGRQIWATSTGGGAGARAVMQSDGNLAIYNATGAAVWSSNSHGTGCPNLVVQDDGNVVIYSPHVLWAAHTVQHIVEPGDVLRPGWSIYSPSEHLRLIMQPDGNLVLYNGAGKPLWASNTDHHPGAYVKMQTDGNLVVYPPSGRALWASDTDHHSGDYLSLQNDGNLVVYNGSKPLWSSKTNGKASGGWQGPRAPSVTSCPVVTTPVSTPVPAPAARHALKVRLKISWTWNHRTTWMHGVRIGRFPGRAEISVECRGRGCPGKRHRSAHGARHVRGLLRRLGGSRYRAGDRVLIILKASGYSSERALIKIRDGRLPEIRSL